MYSNGCFEHKYWLSRSECRNILKKLCLDNDNINKKLNGFTFKGKVTMLN